MNGQREAKIEFLKRNRAVQWALAGLLFCFVSLCFAAFSERILYREGSEVFAMLFEFSGIHVHGLFRYSDVILKMPAFVIFWLTSDSWLWLIYSVGGLAYYLHPFASLFLTYHLIDKDDLKELWIYPVLAFALGVMPSMGFAVNNVSIGVSAFWPALVLVMRDRINLPEKILYVVLVAIMTFSHIPVVLLSVALIAAIIVFRPKDSVFYLVPAVACTFWNFFLWNYISLWEPRDYILKELESAVTSGFLELLAVGSWNFFYLCALSILVLLISVCTWWVRIQKWKSLLLDVLLVVNFAYLIYFCTIQITSATQLWYSFLFRILINAVVFGIALLMIMQKEFGGRLVFSQRKLGIAIFSIILVASLHDLRGTFEWKTISSKVLGKLNHMAANCESISLKEIESIYPRYDPQIVLTSILLQHTRRPSKIIGTQNSFSSGPNDFCQSLRDGYLNYGGYSRKVIDAPFFKYDLLQVSR